MLWGIKILSGLGDFFGAAKNRFLIYAVVAGLIIIALGGAYIKILRMERDAAVLNSQSDQKKFEASQRALKTITEVLEQARKDDGERYVFTEKTRNEMSILKDDRPLSVNQRIVAKRVRERYANKYRN